MINSMTGYGSSQHAESGVSYVVEIRSVNNRYRKLAIKLPEHLQFAEAFVEKWLRARVARGTVDFSLRVRSQNGTGACMIRSDKLQAYVEQLAGVKVPQRLQATVDLAALAMLPGVCEDLELDADTRERQLAVIEQLTREALDSLSAMRRDEGLALKNDLDATRAAIGAKLAVIAERAPRVVEEYQERLRSRVAVLLKGAELDLESEALMREVAIFAERCDISEELSRLGSHLDQFAELCGSAEPVGRTLDFLTQELLREANTIASKSNDAVIARQIVEIKGLIDRLREQVQNVE
jgi:uncharacterized protein (TIGR00255 family)